MPEDQQQTTTVTNQEAIEVKLGDIVLPVPPRQMRIKQTLKVDEIAIPGRSGKVKQPVGYEDSNIEIELEIPNEEIAGSPVKTSLDRFKEIQSIFRPSSESVQNPMPIVSSLTEACGIEQVLIKDIDLRDDPDYDYLICTLTLTEFDSIANQLSEQAIAAQQADEALEEADENMPEELENPEDSYLIDQFNAGKSSAMGEDYPGESAGDDTG